ncbi:MAG: glutamate--tRNA ligase [bacterium]|nr:glutamate--tRNA ligase [bacterium]
MFNFFRKNKVRVRIAPSPTGYLHIGTARTALFNLLFAKKMGGKFILRIEDTDLERSEKRFEEDIIQSLKWLGLDWDEGPYRQSERLDIYEKYLIKLLKDKKAYYCKCRKEDLEKERELQTKLGEPLKYSGKCADQNISPDQASLIRFKINAAQVVFKDLIRGEINFDSALIGDIAIAKNLRTPLYNFAVVIDDYEMKISHVIRGEDHIANTPKQILLQQALGFPEPKYAHLPLILDPDRSKMSKRFSATSIQEYREQGYLPEALVNFMALLGWHPSDDKEKMDIDEITIKFEIDRIQKGGAVFDVKKLDWLNSEYLRGEDNAILLKSIKELYGKELGGLNDEVLFKMLTVGKARISKLRDFLDLKASFDLLEYSLDLLIWKDTDKKIILENLKKSREILRTVLNTKFNKEDLEKELMPMADTRGRGAVLWPLRAALSGKDKSPGPFELMDVLGKDETLKRIELAIQKLEFGGKN